MAGDDPNSSAPQDDNDDYVSIADLEFTYDDDNNVVDLSFTQNPPPPTASAREICDPIESGHDVNDNINNNVIGENIGSNNNNDGNDAIETNRLDGSTRGPNFEIGGTSNHVPVAPTITQGINVCSTGCSNIIDMIYHANDSEKGCLTIFGDTNVCHGVLQTHRRDTTNYECSYQTFHFEGLSNEDVEHFIKNYKRARELEGSRNVRDANTNSISNQSHMLPPQSRDIFPPLPPYLGLREEAIKKKKSRGRQTPLAAQRKRTKRMTLQDVSNLFRFPIGEAAKQLGVSKTVLQKIRRRGGLARWPYRKVESKYKKILEDEKKDGKIDEGVKMEIERKLNEYINELLRIGAEKLRKAAEKRRKPGN